MTNTETQLAGLFARFEAPRARLGKALRAKLRARLPGLAEIVYLYENQDALVLSYSPTEQGRDGVCTLRVDPEGVRLYLAHGAVLAKSDKAKLLQGKASVRYVAMDSAADLDRPEVQALIAAALTLAKVRLAPDAEGPTHFRVESQAKRARRAKS